MMKKNTLLKVIGILALVLVVLSWIIPASYYSGSSMVNLGLMRIGFYELFNYPFLAFQYFIQTVLFILMVGALYGVLEKTGKYRNILEKIAKSLKGKEIIFLVVVAFVLAAISSLLGLTLISFIFIPALIAIIMLMGYDKITAFLVTFVSIFIGMIGSVYNSNINGYINQVIGAEYNNEIISKIALLVISFVVYIFFTIKYAKKANKKAENANEEIPFIGEKKQSKCASWPLYVVFGVIFVLIVFGLTPWSTVFNVDTFTKLHESVTTWTVGEHTIVSYILGGMLEFGSWTNIEVAMLLLVASIVIGLSYKLKLSEIVNGLLTGINKTMKIALLVVFAMIIVIITAYHPSYLTITEWIIGLSSKFNIFLTSIVAIIGSVLNIDMIYIAQSSMPFIADTFAAESTVNTLAIISQAFYGLTMIVAPTSTLMILGLTYLDIPYFEWLKKSWKLILGLFAVIIAIIFITVLI